MRNFLDQIQIALENNSYYLALFSSLAIPDICGALGSNNGIATKDKYIQWFNKYVGEIYRNFITGTNCYIFRCSLLHKCSTQNNKNLYSRIIFIEPPYSDSFSAHCCKSNDALLIDAKIFCNDMINGAKKWLKECENTDLFRKNYKKFMRRYKDGISPYIKGIPVIS